MKKCLPFLLLILSITFANAQDTTKIEVKLSKIEVSKIIKYYELGGFSQNEFEKDSMNGNLEIIETNLDRYVKFPDYLYEVITYKYLRLSDSRPFNEIPDYRKRNIKGMQLKSAQLPDGTVNHFAVIVGINDYGPLISRSNLYGCVTDAENMFDVLTTVYDFPSQNIRLRTDRINNSSDDITSSQVLDDLDWLAREADENDVVLFYFSGHGYGATGQTTYLCTPDPSWIADYQLNNKLDKIKAEAKIVIMDACRSGGIREYCKDDGRWLLAAAGNDENSRDGMFLTTPIGISGGVFTSWLVDGMTYYESAGRSFIDRTIYFGDTYSQNPDDDENGNISIQEAFGYAKECVEHLWLNLIAKTFHPEISPLIEDIGIGKYYVPPVDNIAPTALNKYFENEPGTIITVTFNEPINTETLVAANIQISGSKSGLHSFYVAYDSESYTIILDPTYDFDYNETVTVTLGTGITDLSGNGLDGDGNGTVGPAYSFFFDIGSANAGSVIIASDEYFPNVNDVVSLEALVRDPNGGALSGVEVTFTSSATGTISGSNPATTNANGIATITYSPKENGNHIITATADNGESGQTSLSVGGSFWPPVIHMTYPNNEVCHDNCYIGWTDLDQDNNALIYLYYDTNNSGENGTCINPGNPIFEDSPDGYIWNTINMPEGTYWIYAVITDGFNDPYIDYSPGYIEIKHPALNTDLAYYSRSSEEDEGDGDGIIEEGESFNLEIRIENESSTKAYNQVKGTLTTSNPNVTITDDYVYYRDIAAGEHKYGEGDFDVQVANGYDGSVYFDLNLEFKDDVGYEYYQVLEDIRVTVSEDVSPGFEVVGVRILDNYRTSNQDGILQSGERRADFQLQIQNNGAGDAIDVDVVIESILPDFTTFSQSEPYPDIDAGTAEWPAPDDYFVIDELPADFVGTINCNATILWGDELFSETVPFSLEVFPTPRLDCDPEIVDFGIKALGDTAKIPFVLRNYGSADLIVSDIQDQNPNVGNWLSNITFPHTIEPGTKDTIYINIKRDNPENTITSFNVISNQHTGEEEIINISGTFFDPKPAGYVKLWYSDSTVQDDSEWIEPGDFDNDGLIDLVMYDSDELYIWEQKAVNSFEFEHKFTHVASGLDPFIDALRVGNTDGDDKIDIVFLVRDQEPDPQIKSLYVMETTGNDQYEVVWSTSSELLSGDQLAVGNTDNDDYDEIVTIELPQNQTKVRVFNRTGDNSYGSSSSNWLSPDLETLYEDCNAFGYLTTGDTDKDGKNEIILTADECLFIWEYNGSYGLIHDPYVITTPKSGWYDDGYPLVFDVDNDNKNEIIISGPGNDREDRDGSLRIFDPSTWSIEFYNSPLLYKDCTGPAVADLNGNGTPEIFFGEEDNPNRMIVYEYDNGSYFEIFKSDTVSNEIWNIEDCDLNNDGTPELVISHDKGFMIWGYEEVPELPDLQITANNLQFLVDEPTDANLIEISATVQNIGLADTGNIPFEFFISDVEIENRIDSFTISTLNQLKDTTITISLGLLDPGGYSFFAVIDRVDHILELDSTNNIQFKTISVVDNDTTAPEFLESTYEELYGDGDDFIEDNEYIRINWSLFDESGIDSTYVIFNEQLVLTTAALTENDYYAVVENQAPGIYPFEIYAYDGDNSSLASVIYDTIEVIQHAPNVISNYPATDASDIYVYDSIVVEFDMSISASTLNNNTLLLLKNGTEVVDLISIIYEAGSNRVVFRPAVMEYGTYYTVKLVSGSSGIKDRNDNSLDADFIWNFTTEEEEIVNDCPQYFHPVWEGTNGVDQMNLYIFDAKLDGFDLGPGDEVGVFDGDICVGYGKVEQTINNQNILHIEVSRDDEGTGIGYTAGNEITYRFWDCSGESEFSVSNSQCYDNQFNVISCLPFTAGATNFVALSTTTEVCLTTELEMGWNLFATPVTPESPDMLSVFQPMIDNSYLVKIQDEKGLSMEDLGVFGGWTNFIGDISTEEGYKVKLEVADSITVCGITPEYPFGIYLNSSWNIIGFPNMYTVDAMEVIQPLIDNGNLIKVQDEEGKSIEDWGIFGGWQNLIGNFQSGEGYKIKVSSSDTLWIEESYPKSLAKISVPLPLQHFKTGIEGNGVDHMNFNLVGLTEQLLTAGDELAVYDGVNCVGALVLTEEMLRNGFAAIAASANDNSGMFGFSAGNEYHIRLWQNASNTELEIETEYVQGAELFTKHESVVLNLENTVVTGIGELTELKPADVSCYPNPFKKELTIEIDLPADSKTEVFVVSQTGQRIIRLLEKSTLNRGIHQLKWNAQNTNGGEVAPGVYHIVTEINGTIYKSKVVLTY